MTPDTVLQFWLADGVRQDWPGRDMKALWFGGGSALDAQISLLFGPTVATALAGGLRDWEAEPGSRLALVIVLDQFSRNVHRGSATAFSGDARAQQLVTHALAQGWDRQLTLVSRVFLYMPLMHAENLSLQDEGVRCFEQLAADAPAELKEKIQGNAAFARQHRDIVARFGRFPHRNSSLGRSSSPDETAFLVDGPRFGQ